MGDLIHAEKASIAIATVELRVVRVGAKQMTHSVFRQLPDTNWEGDPGSAWGFVNYHNKCDSGDHRHVLHVADGILSQASVYKVTPADVGISVSREINEWAEKYIAAKALSGTLQLEHDGLIVDVAPGRPLYFRAPKPVLWYQVDAEWKPQVEKISRGITEDEAYADLIHAATPSLAYWDMRIERWRVAKDLPQVYIAA